MEQVRIINLISDKISGEWGDESSFEETSVNVIRTANFTNSGLISYSNIVKREIEHKKIQDKQLINGDIIIEKSGGSPNQPVGRVVFFERPNEEVFLCNNFTSILRPDASKIVPKYLFYLLYFNYQARKVIEYQNKTTGIINLQLGRYLNSNISYEPNIEIQNKIVAVLDKAKDILAKREVAIEKYDELLSSTFLEMFGDPVGNLKKWEMKSLSEFGTFKNGLNYASNEEGFNVSCLGVGDFKSLWKISGINALSKISLSRMPGEDYFLVNGDLVFVRSNGSKELVGRCIAIYPQDSKVTFSGFCIRYRPFNNCINSIYVAQIFRIPVFRKKMLQNGRGANIQNINQQLLKSLKIPYPPIDLQNEFALRIEQIEKIRNKNLHNRDYSQNLMNSLSKLVFKGELDFNTAVDLELLLEHDYDFFSKNSNSKSIQLLLERIDKNDLNDKKFYGQEIYDKAKVFVFELLKEGKIKQVFDENSKKIKLTI